MEIHVFGILDSLGCFLLMLSALSFQIIKMTNNVMRQILCDNKV